MEKTKNNRDYVTHLPVDFGDLPNRYIINEGKRLIIKRYTNKNNGY